MLKPSLQRAFSSPQVSCRILGCSSVTMYMPLVHVGNCCERQRNLAPGAVQQPLPPFTPEGLQSYGPQGSRHCLLFAATQPACLNQGAKGMVQPEFR
jgi:hypothetical protein